MDERFEFSPLKPILLVIAAPLAYVYFFDGINLFVRGHFILGLVLMLLVVGYTWKYVRITFLMRTLRPAVVLTDQSITITETNYIIDWKDVKDVYMANSGGGYGIAMTIKSYYITIRVREPEKYLNTIKNPFTRWYRWITRNWRQTGAFEVDLSLVRGDEDEIFHTVLKYYQNNRGF